MGILKKCLSVNIFEKSLVQVSGTSLRTSGSEGAFCQGWAFLSNYSIS